MKKTFFLSVIFGIFATLVYVLVGMTPLARAAELKVFTAQELSQFDGKNGHQAFFAYKGKVYDVTGHPQFKEGEHYGVLVAKDITGQMEGAPHAEEVLVGLTVVGTYSSADATPAVQASTQPAVESATAKTAYPASSTEKKWYEGRIKIAGISLLGWTGILLGVFFVLNFATCFVLPWSALPLPWKGSQPGPDALDTVPVRQKWTSIHKYFAWATVVIGIVHGVIGFMQMLGYSL